MASGEAPLAILGLLARQTRLVWQVKDAISRGIPSGQITQRLNLFPSAYKNYSQQASLFSDDELNEIHSSIREADVALKSTGTAPVAALEALIVGLCLRKTKSL